MQQFPIFRESAVLRPFPSLAPGSPLHPLHQRKTSPPHPPRGKNRASFCLRMEEWGGGCFSPASLLMPPTGRTHRGVGDKSASHIESQLGKTLGVSGVVCSAHLRAAGEPGLPPGLSTKEGNSKELKELRSSLPLRCQ